MPRSRRPFVPATYKCPHCVKPEKWCKNSSGLTQHLNAVHIDLYRAPSPPSSPSPPPLEYQDSDLALADYTRDSPGRPHDSTGGVRQDPQQYARAHRAYSQHSQGDVIWEHHPIMNGLPCDEHGQFLQDKTHPPPPRTHAPHGDWSPFRNRAEFELAEFLYKTEQMSGNSPDAEDDSAPHRASCDDASDDDPYTGPIEDGDDTDREDIADGTADLERVQDDDEADGNGVVPGPRVSGFVVLLRKHKRGYPRTLGELGTHIGVPNLPLLVARFLYQQNDSAAGLTVDEELSICPPSCYVRVYHSAVATFYAPSDPSGVGGMHREYIRATPSWRRGPPRYDCAFVGKDPKQVGFRSLHAARVRLFFSFLPPTWAARDSDANASAWVPCALLEWFSEVGDEPDEDTGLWVVEPDYDERGERVRDVVHIQTLLRAAHLIPVFGEDPTPHNLQQHEVLDSYRAFYVNKYADHHAHEVAF